MYLDAANHTEELVFEIANLRPSAEAGGAYDKWIDWLPSEVRHHGLACCEIALEWLKAYDLSSLKSPFVQTGPRWLRRKFKWGPSTYPVHWCEAVRREMLDCGALAAIAHEIYTARGVQAFRVQFVQRFSPDATAQWAVGWASAGASVAWIGGELAYHEGNAVTDGGEIRIWDPSAGWWVDPSTTSGYGSVTAVRISAGDGTQNFIWGPHQLAANRWNELS